ncbi:MAG: hypothetical protein HJJLKODD_01481 [Phycisphaerae bacterium]|nr:hypothetical protein [Phycisphaerae bacterium]
MRVLVTGSGGLIGSEAVEFYHQRGASVQGIDNNLRADFFGPQGDIRWNLERLRSTCPGYQHHFHDIRDRRWVLQLMGSTTFDLIIHSAAQPSHDLAASRPFDDFETNALATLNLLEAMRQYQADAVFVYLSTNKVYGDGPNRLRLHCGPLRYDFAEAAYAEGIDEHFSIDQNLHSLFGASKAAADLLVQEYGRYFGLRTGVFRGGCLTGRHHSAVQLHGFLSYLVSVAWSGAPYTIIGYEGKQVRDQICSSDVLTAINAFYQQPHPGEVYNIGGGRSNSVSIREVLILLEQMLARPLPTNYEPQARRGDHICYYTNLAKLRAHYPHWRLTRTVPQLLEEILQSVSTRSPAGAV